MDEPEEGPEQREWRVRALARLGIQPGEFTTAALGALFFFALLASYYLLRPLRDAYGAERPDDLAWLFLGTLGVTVAFQPAFGAVVSRFGRSRIAPTTFRALALVTLVLGTLLVRLEGAPERAAQVGFFLWLSVFSVAGVSLFWGLVGDLLGRQRSLRLFGPIAVGGTLGAMAGSSVVAFAGALLPVLSDAPFAYAFLSAALLEVCARLSRMLERRALALPGEIGQDAGAREAERARPIGGGVLDGFAHVARSPYLALIAVYVVIYVTGSTLLYDVATRIMSDAFPDANVRSIFYARIDLLTNAITLLIQLGLTRYVLERVGIGAGLAAVPIISAIGFGAVLVEPTFGAIALFSVLRRCAEYGVSKPARDALFTVASDEDRYKAKLVVDTVAYRGGDAGSLWLKNALVAAGASASALMVGLVGVAIAGTAVSFALGRKYRRRAGG